MDAIWQTLPHSKKGPQLKCRKNPVIAFFCGFGFGPFGTGLYLRSPYDFFMPLVIIIVASVSTMGLAAPVAWLFCGVWGAMRAVASNKALEHSEQLENSNLINCKRVDRASEVVPSSTLDGKPRISGSVTKSLPQTKEQRDGIYT